MLALLGVAVLAASARATTPESTPEPLQPCPLLSRFFVADRSAGEGVAQPAAVERISRGRARDTPDGGSGAPVVSADARYVAFHSSASNLVAGDTNEVADVFVYDRRLRRT